MARQTIKMFLLTGLMTLVLGGCFVQGEDAPAGVAVSLKITDETGLVPRVLQEQEDAFSVAFQVKVDAADFTEPQTGQLVLGPEVDMTSAYELSLEVEAGAERSISAVLFKVQGETLKSYATEEPAILDLVAGETRMVDLTVSRLETSEMDLVVLGAESEEVISAAMIDQETGFQLPMVVCEEQASSLTCSFTDLPVGRVLFPALFIDEQQRQDFSSSTVTLPMPKNQMELELSLVEIEE